MLVILYTLLFNLIFVEGERQWSDLFNGKDLSNFEVVNGRAEYYVDDESIVGISRLNTPNTFLATKRTYSNFILEFEVLIANGLNSGVQIRSICDPEILSGRVHGYQVEIETSPRKWSGGIYDESRRLWMYPLAVNPSGREAFKLGKWNKYRIEAIGSHIRTWVNGIACSRLVDDLTLEGIIAFQVHSIGDSSQAGKEVRWRNIRIKEVSPKSKGNRGYKKAPEISFLVNTLTEHEKREGWELLADWQEVDDMYDHPTTGWQNDSPAGQLDSGEGTNVGRDVATTGRYSNFVLEFDFRVNRGGRSEVMYLVDDEFYLSFCIADEENVSNDLDITGALTGLIPPGNLSEVNNDKRRYWGTGVWNKGRIVCENGTVEHWINNVKVMQANLDDPDFFALLSKQRGWNATASRQGRIQFHQEGDGISFRSIKLKGDL